MPLELLDYPVATLTSFGNGTGQPLEIDFDEVPLNEVWRVDQIALIVIPGNVTLTSAPRCTIYDRAHPGPTTVPIQWTNLSRTDLNSAIRYVDYDDQGSPLTVRGGGTLAFVFDNFGAGVLYGVRIQYASYAGVPGKPTIVAGGTPGPTIPAGL